MTSQYALGHSAEEIQRLRLQTEVFESTVRRLAHASGIGPGMRVLDLGCGAGEYTLVLSKIVGNTGSVVGIDKEAAPIPVAAARAVELGVRNVEFRNQDLEGVSDAGKFDAVFCRYVLIHQRDPVSFLANAADMLRPTGTMVLQEPAFFLSGLTTPEVPLWHLLFSTLSDFGLKAFPSGDVAGRMLSVVRAAGLDVAGSLTEMIIGDSNSAYVDWGVESYVTFNMKIKSLGVDRPELGDPTTLRERLRRDMSAINAEFIGCPQIGVWAKKRSSD